MVAFIKYHSTLKRGGIIKMILLPFEASLIRKGTKKEITFFFNRERAKSRTYNHATDNIYSERVDMVIHTTANLDFRVKDTVKIKEERFFISHIGPEEFITPFNNISLKTLELVRVANNKPLADGI